jgi:hypothetical protein
VFGRRGRQTDEVITALREELAATRAQIEELTASVLESRRQDSIDLEQAREAEARHQAALEQERSRVLESKRQALLELERNREALVAHRDEEAEARHQAMLELERAREARAAARDDEIARLLNGIALACEAVAEEVRADRRGRADLRDAVATLAALMAAPGLTEVRSTVLGGSVDPSAPREIVLETDGDDRPEPPRDGVEVRCRFGDHWVSGFDVVDAIEEDGEMRYQLRRRSDGCILPAAFAAADVRFFTTAPATR